MVLRGLILLVGLLLGLHGFKSLFENYNALNCVGELLFDLVKQQLKALFVQSDRKQSARLRFMLLLFSVFGDEVLVQTQMGTF